MIICTVQPVYRYSGLSTDTKPIENVIDASTFWETDTGHEFELRGGVWQQRPSPKVEVEIPQFDSVQVSNFPAVQPVSGEISIARQPLTASAPAGALVGTDSSVVVAANANRKGLTIINTSLNFVSLAFGTDAVLYSGVTLNPMGGCFWMDVYSLTTADVRAIASDAASNLSIQEMI